MEHVGKGLAAGSRRMKFGYGAGGVKLKPPARYR